MRVSTFDGSGFDREAAATLTSAPTAALAEEEHSSA
jgi:hypothetical protein